MSKTYNQAVAELITKLIKARTEKNLSFRCVSKMTGITENSLKQFEETKNINRSVVLFVWAKALGFDLKAVDACNKPAKGNLPKGANSSSSDSQDSNRTHSGRG